MGFLDSLKGKPASAQTVNNAPHTAAPAPSDDEAKDSGTALMWRYAGLVLAVVGMVVVAVAMFLSVRGLGVLFKLDNTLSTVTAGACVIAWMAHGLLAAFAHKNALRFWNGIGVVVWLVIAVMLIAAHNVMRLVGIDEQTSINEMQELLRQGARIVPADLIVNGRLAYAVLIALAAITLSASLFAAYGMMRPIKDADGTLGRVAAKAGISAVVVAAAIYSGLHVFTFGVVVLGVDPFTAMASAVLAELTFIAAFKRAIDTKRGYYVVLAGVAIGYALLINWLEGRALIIMKSVDPNMGPAAQAAALAWIQADPMARLAADLYAVAGVLFALSLAIVEFITHRDEARAAAGVQPTSDGTPFAIRTADKIRATRAGFNEIKGALREPARPALPAGTVLADEGVKDAADARRLIDGIHNPDDELNPKTSATGAKYSTTGVVVDAEQRGYPQPKDLEDGAGK